MLQTIQADQRGGFRTFVRVIELSAFDARDFIDAGDGEAAFLHARDAAHYARQMMRAFAEEQAGNGSMIF